jgi:hypothetical protein
MTSQKRHWIVAISAGRHGFLQTLILRMTCANQTTILTQHFGSVTPPLAKPRPIRAKRVDPRISPIWKRSKQVRTEHHP